MKRFYNGFTLIELLVVIAIIAILSGIMIISFGRSGESARAAKCLVNLRNLAQGANAYASSSGYYPLAGSVQVFDGVNSGSVSYKEYKGWISWLSNKGAYGSGGKGTSKSVVKCDPPRYSGFGDERDNLYVITNGTLWRAINMTRDVYRCPTHSLAVQDKGEREPIFSYVMSGYFGYDTSMGSKAAKKLQGLKYGLLPNTERYIMFAELPLFDPKTGQYLQLSDDWTKDATLQYSATVNGQTYGKAWKGAPESIGFNHKIGKKGYCAHVVYADGHTESLSYGTGSGLKSEQLTALLCEGKEVIFNGSGYQEIEEDDE